MLEHIRRSLLGSRVLSLGGRGRTGLPPGLPIESMRDRGREKDLGGNLVLRPPGGGPGLQCHEKGPVLPSAAPHLAVVAAHGGTSRPTPLAREVLQVREPVCGVLRQDTFSNCVPSSTKT